jgi:hypothetical protein
VELVVARKTRLNIYVPCLQDKYIAPMVVQMLQMMTDLEEEENWAMEDEVEDVDSDVSREWRGSNRLFCGGRGSS